MFQVAKLSLPHSTVFLFHVFPWFLSDFWLIMSTCLASVLCVFGILCCISQSHLQVPHRSKLVKNMSFWDVNPATKPLIANNLKFVVHRMRMQDFKRTGTADVCATQTTERNSSVQEIAKHTTPWTPWTPHLALIVQSLPDFRQLHFCLVVMKPQGNTAQETAISYHQVTTLSSDETALFHFIPYQFVNW